MVGLVPSPEFPFLPSAEELGTAGKVAVAVAGLLFAISAFLLRPLLGPAPDLAELAGPAAVSLAALVGLRHLAHQPVSGAAGRHRACSCGCWPQPGWSPAA